MNFQRDYIYRDTEIGMQTVNNKQHVEVMLQSRNVFILLSISFMEAQRLSG